MTFNLKKVAILVATIFLFDFTLVGCNKATSGTITVPEIKAEKSISVYDPIFKEAAQTYGYDWRLISAIAFAESRFQPHVKSQVGAVGLMQVMPKTARHFGVDASDITDPTVNVDVAVKVLKKIEETLRFGQATQEQKLKIILAGYNSGLGNLIEARKMAAGAGVNHNNWETLKNYGAINNGETRSFVEKVMVKYSQYKQLY